MTTFDSDTVRRELPSGFELEHERGKLRVHELAPGVFLQEYEGVMIDDYFPPVAALVERRLADGLALTLISDISHTHSLTPGYRKSWSGFVAKHGEHIDAVLVLLNSPLQRMAVNAANAATGGRFTAFTELETFQTAVEAAVIAAEQRVEAAGGLAPQRSSSSEAPAAAADSSEGRRIATVRLPSTANDLSHESSPSDGTHESSADGLDEPGPGMLIDGAYRLGARIGRGGMGTVHRAVQLSLDREVAVKLIRLDRRHHGEAYTRFKREIDLVAHLNHPNIVQVHDAGDTEQGLAYFVMELLEGQRLDRHVPRTGLEPSYAIELFRQLCDGVQAAHAEGLIHRDLSAANVFIVDRKHGKLVKILDFGLAKSRRRGEQELTLDGQILGTPGFMAPEQIEESSELDQRTDVYALGALLYFMLSGARAFVGKSAAATISLQLRGEYLPLPRAHRRFAKLVERALSLDAEDRQASVAALWAEVEEAARMPVPSARPPAARARWQRWLPWALVGLAVAATAAGAAVLRSM